MQHLTQYVTSQEPTTESTADNHSPESDPFAPSEHAPSNPAATEGHRVAPSQVSLPLELNTEPPELLLFVWWKL